LSEDFIFLGDSVEKYLQDNSIKPTTSLRDMCKRLTQIFYGGGQLLANRMYRDEETLAGTLLKNDFIRMYRIFTIPLLPERSTNSGGQTVVPAWYQQFGLYQGFRGGMKLRFRICMDRSSVASADSSLIPMKEARPFHVLICLDDAFIGATRTGSTTTYGNMAENSLPTILIRSLGSSDSTFNSFACSDFGLLAMESVINNEIDIEVEVPVHLFNKYHELLGQIGDESQFSECRPVIRVYVYQDVMIDNSSNATLPAVLQSAAFKNANMNTQVKMEVFQSFADDARCGVLDEYPYLLQFGTDVYFTPGSTLPVNTSAIVPYTSV